MTHTTATITRVIEAEAAAHGGIVRITASSVWTFSIICADGHKNRIATPIDQREAGTSSAWLRQMAKDHGATARIRYDDSREMPVISITHTAEERPEEAVETLAATSIATHPSERDGEAPEYHDEASVRDRDPADPSVVADELAAWIEAQSSDDEIERDEADLALDAALLEQGVICPTDTIDWITWGDDFVTIGLASGEEIWICRTTGELAG